MFISASRRTDIPSYYSDWFFNRIKEGFVMVRYPMNLHQIGKIKLTPDVVDGIVFWTKNPANMFNRLGELRDYTYYFQFTITPYGKDIEPNLPSKSTNILTVFRRLSDMVGADRIIWRYDPVLINARYTLNYHIKAFEKIAKQLHAYTRKVTISFIDTHYRAVKDNFEKLVLYDFSLEKQIKLAEVFAGIAFAYGLNIDACSENIDLKHFGIKKARCIDDRLFEELIGCSLSSRKDKTQRVDCGCSESIDIGMYNTCLNSCLYCYANYSGNKIAVNFAAHNPLSPLISGEIGASDQIFDRKLKSLKVY